MPSLDIISCRESGNSPYDLGYLSMMERGSRIPITTSYIDNLPEEVGILISGYNMPDDRAEDSYCVIVEGMAAAGVNLHWIGFTWPTGKGYSWVVPNITSWFNKDTEKTVVMGRASNSGQILRAFLLLLKQAGKRVVIMQTHSLGARVALEALNGGDVNVDHVILSAPAVDDDVLQNGKEYSQAAFYCRSFNLAVSKNDSVLTRLYRITNFGLDRALGISGPRNNNLLPPNIRTFDFSNHVKGHSEYRLKPQYFDTIRLIKDGNAPSKPYNLVA